MMEKEKDDQASVTAASIQVQPLFIVRRSPAIPFDTSIFEYTNIYTTQ